MRVLQVTPRYPPHSGGVETHVQEVSERLVERGHEVVIHSADRDTEVRTRERRNGVEVYRHRSLAPGGAFHVAPGIAATVRCSDADIIHAHNYHSLPAFFAALGVTDQRFVVTPHYHGASASGFRDRLLSLYRPFGKRALRAADQVVAVSDWERDRLREDFDVDATVIPNGLDADRFGDADPVSRDRPFLLAVGRLEEYKGVQHVIRTLPELPSYDFVVVGSGPYRDELERIARESGVAERVDFRGYVPDEALPGLYAGAEVYVTLSSFESYGMTVAEALAAETSCVVRAAGALTDWVDKPGVVGASDTSPATVAAAVRKATAINPEWTPPTWSQVVDQLLDVYRDE